MNGRIIEEVGHLLLKLDVYCDQYSLQEVGRRVIAEYERTVPSDRLQAILSERRGAVNEIVRAKPMLAIDRMESHACRRCGEPIPPGQAYAVDGPEHIGCRR